MWTKRGDYVEKMEKMRSKKSRKEVGTESHFRGSGDGGREHVEKRGTGKRGTEKRGTEKHGTEKRGTGKRGYRTSLLFSTKT